MSVLILFNGTGKIASENHCRHSIPFILPINGLDHPIFLTTKLPCMHLCCVVCSCSVLPFVYFKYLPKFWTSFFVCSSLTPLLYTLMEKGLYLHLIYMMSLLSLDGLSFVHSFVQLGLQAKSKSSKMSYCCGLKE